MNKKGISPLIATVLLIGSTIALAALVMVWSQNLFQSTTERTGRGVEAEIICASDVQFRITSITGTESPLTIEVLNNGDHPIEEFKARIYSDSDDIKVVEITGEVLGEFDSETYTITYSDLDGNLEKVELIPIIKLEDDSLKTCGQNKESRKVE